MDSAMDMELLTCLIQELKRNTSVQPDDLPFCLRNLSPNTMKFLAQNLHSGVLERFLSRHKNIFYSDTKIIVLKSSETGPNHGSNRVLRKEDESAAAKKTEFFHALKEELEEGQRIFLKELPNCLKALEIETIKYFLKKSTNDDPVYNFLTYHSDVFRINDDSTVCLRNQREPIHEASSDEEECSSQFSDYREDEKRETWKKACGIVTKVDTNYGFIRNNDAAQPFRNVYFPRDCVEGGPWKSLYDSDLCIGDTVMMDVVKSHQGKYRAIYVKPIHKAIGPRRAMLNEKSEIAKKDRSETEAKRVPNRGQDHQARHNHGDVPRLRSNSGKRVQFAGRDRSLTPEPRSTNPKFLGMHKQAALPCKPQADSNARHTEGKGKPVQPQSISAKGKKKGKGKTEESPKEAEPMTFYLPSWDTDLTTKIFRDMVIPAVMETIKRDQCTQNTGILRQKEFETYKSGVEMTIMLKPFQVNESGRNPSGKTPKP